MISVYSYTNYRDYLRDYFEEVKDKNRLFSYRAYCRSLGFTSPNFLRMIILGTRNLSGDGIKKVANGLGLKKREADFFSSLVGFTQAKSHNERVANYERMCFFKAFMEIKKIDNQSYRYFSKWYYPTIREMTLIEGFREDPRWIASHLSGTVTEEEVKEAITLLVELGLVERDKTNKIRAVDKNISTSNDVASISLVNFHCEMMNQAQTSMESTPHSFRDISSITVALDRDSMLKAKTKLQELRQELNLKLSQCKKPDTVYQFNFQMFNLTEIPKSWKN